MSHMLIPCDEEMGQLEAVRIIHQSLALVSTWTKLHDKIDIISRTNKENA